MVLDNRNQVVPLFASDAVPDRDSFPLKVMRQAGHLKPIFALTAFK